IRPKKKMATVEYSIKENLVTCAICSKLWLKRNPKTLPCHHTFCLQCLQEESKVKNGEIICFTCKEACKIPTNGIIDLPESIITPTRNWCENHKKETSIFCIDHNIPYLCDICVRENHKLCNITTMVIHEKTIEQYREKELLKKRQYKQKIDEIKQQLKISIDKQLDNIYNEINEISDQRLEMINSIIPSKGNQLPDVEILKTFVNENVTFSIENDVKIHYKIDNKQIERKFGRKLGKKFDFSKKCFFKSDMKKVLNILQTNSDIEEINLSHNLFISNNLSQICLNLNNSVRTLKVLIIQNCMLIENMCETIGKWILNYCNVIEHLNLSQNLNMGNGLMIICENIKKSTFTLKSLELSNCNLNAKQCESITSLLLKCCNFEYLNLSNNLNIGDKLLRICQALFEKSSKTLRNINFEKCNLDTDSLKQIGKLLKNCSKIQQLNLSKNQIIGYEIFNCIEIIHNSLTSIDLYNCDLDYKACRHLGKLLINCPRIRIIDFGNNLGMDKNDTNGFSELCKGLEESSNSLEKISFHDGGITKKMAACIGNLLTKCYSIKFINLERNLNMNYDSSNICNQLQNSSSTLTFISLTDCNLDEITCKSLAELIKLCKRLEEIYLTGNRNLSTGNVFKDFCKGLENSSKTLKLLILKNCNLNEEHCNYLSQLLTKCCRIEILNLSQNQMIGKGLKSVYRDSCNTLTSIEISDCNLNVELCESLTVELKKFKSIVRLQLTGNPDMKNGLIDILKQIGKCSPFLKDINLSKCNLNSQICRKIAVELRKLSQIQYLSLTGNTEMGEGLEKIIEALQSSSLTLKELYLNECRITERIRAYLQQKYSRVSLII
ncbi:unnamed protein product, partial [Dimorphilus gyrociliatus]